VGRGEHCKVWAQPEGEGPCTCVWVGWLRKHREGPPTTMEKKRETPDEKHWRRAELGHGSAGNGGGLCCSLLNRATGNDQKGKCAFSLGFVQDILRCGMCEQKIRGWQGRVIYSC